MLDKYQNELMFEKPNWYVLYTKSNNEKLVEAELLKKGIEAYVPKVVLRRKWSDRIKFIEEPLFKSYCFARFSLLKNTINILSQQGVVQIVNFNYQYIPVEQSVIDSLKILIDNELTIDPCPYLKEGTRIIIKRGLLKGLEGYVIEKRDNNMGLVVSVDTIRASVRCNVDVGMVSLA